MRENETGGHGAQVMNTFLERTAGEVAQRIARSSESIAEVRLQVAAWFDERRGDIRFARFNRHFDVLDVVLTRMLDSLDEAVEGLGADGEAGEVYDECRALDRGLLYVQSPRSRWPRPRPESGVSPRAC